MYIDDDQHEMLLRIFKIIFKDSIIEIESLSELTDENKLLEMFLEIEPKFYTVAQVPYLTFNKNSNTANKFTNYIELFSCFEKYLNNSSEKFRFNRKLEINSLIIPMELVKGKKEQLVNVGELILIMCAISSKKNIYLDMLNDSDQENVSNFLAFVEKYLHIEAKEDREKYGSRKNFTRIRTIVVNDDNEIRRKILNNKIQELEKELAFQINKYDELNNSYIDLELQFKDVSRENEMIKMNLKSHNQVAEDFYNDALQITTLKNDLVRKDIEIEDIKRMHELKIKNLQDEMDKFINKLEIADDKLAEMRSIRHENEKLKIKIKEYNMIKDKISDYNKLETAVEEKNTQIDELLKEKAKYLARIEELLKENNQEKIKMNNTEYEKKKLEFELNEIKKIDTKVEMKRRKSLHPGHIVEFNSNLNLEILLNMEKQNDPAMINELKEEIEELENEVLEINNQYIEQLEINREIVKVKEEALNQYQHLQIAIENEKSRNERLLIDLEKLSLEKQNVELEIQKYLISIDKLENSKSILIDEKIDLNSKLESLNNEKQKHVEEISKYKVELKSLKDRLDKLLSEKQKLVHEYRDLQLVNDKLRKVESTIRKESLLKKSTIGNSRNSVFEDKVEINKLKVLLSSKDDVIKELHEKINTMSKSGNDKDYEYYKRSFEEQKQCTALEHELLSNSLYDLTLQFVALKNELVRNVKPTP